MHTYADLLELADAAEIVLPPGAEPSPADIAAKTVEPERFSNAELVLSENADQKTPEAIPRPMVEIVANLLERTDGELHRLARAIFAHAAGNDAIDWLESTASLFGWIQSKLAVIDWRRGVGFVGKEELFAELQRVAPRCLAVETIPHEPPLTGHYYTCGAPEPGDGSALARLVTLHALETDLDCELATALWATAIWGGPPGTRPAFLITATGGRGKGKSKFCQHFARTFNGAIDVSLQEDIGVIKQRLLSPDAIHKRNAILDNVKSMRFSWGELESLITSDTINGKRMYVGDASRPNILVWTITLNGANLSTDMAQRVVEIQLRDPAYDSDWEENVHRYIDAHRQAIIADCIAFLRRPAKMMKQHSRWATWESQVLSKVDHPDACLDLILSRRSESDLEEEEALVLEDFIGGRLRGLGYDRETDDIFIPNEILARWFNEATGEKHRVTGVTRKIKQLRDEGRLWRLVPWRVGEGGQRGARWIGEHVDTQTGIKRDLMKRLAEKKESAEKNEKEDAQRSNF